MCKIVEWRTIRGVVEWFSHFVQSMHCLFGPLPSPATPPPWFPPCSPSHGFLQTLLSSDTGRMAPRSENGGMLETGVMSALQEKIRYIVIARVG